MQLRHADVDSRLSVPSSSGNTLQHACSGRVTATRSITFSPLFIGEYSSTDVAHRNVGASRFAFQSPLHRGILFNAAAADRCGDDVSPFSPLFIGEYSSTSRESLSEPRSMCSFSPLFIGEYSSTVTRLRRVGCVEFPFSPLFIGEYSSTDAMPLTRRIRSCLSVPSSSGNTLQLKHRQFSSYGTLQPRGRRYALSVPSSSGNTLQPTSIDALSVPSSSGNTLQRAATAS